MSELGRLRVEDVRVAATPGQQTAAIVTVHNHGDSAANAVVRTVGLGDGWASPPSAIGPIAPGEAVETELIIQVPAGFPPCEHLGAVEVESVDVATGAPLGDASSADLVIVIGDASLIQATLEPADLVGSGKSRFQLALGNRAGQPMHVRLEGDAPSEQLTIHFDREEAILPAGQTVRVQGRIKSSRRLLGPRQRFPFYVRVQGRTTPLMVDGSYTQRPVMSGGLLKLLAIMTALALWASLLVFGLGKLGEHKESNAAKNANAAAAESLASDNSGAATDGEGGANGEANGAGGANGSGGSAGETKIGGKVKSSDPSDVTVTLEPTSLVDENAQGATFEQGSAPDALARGMHYGHRSVAVQQVATPRKSTTSDNDGVWAFAGVRAPGFYLLSFSKAGYGTRKFVVSAPEDGSPVKLDAELVAGDGSLAGMVFGPDGQPLGGVDLAISDGRNTLTTATPTTEAVGSWGIQGLTTPGTYLITASRRGFGTETQLIDLSAGGSQGGVTFNMVSGVGSITGLVTDGSLIAPANGAKGVSVTAASGDLTRTVSTATVGNAGAFSIPQLPIPGKYTLTVTGDGYLPSAQTVDLDPDFQPNALLQITLTPSTGSVTGFVVGPPITPGQPLPTPIPADVGLDTVGITIANETVKLKTTSATGTDGKFVQNHVPPGRYVVTYEKFGYETQSAEMEVRAGQTTQVPDTGDPATTGRIRLPPASPESIKLTGKVSVTVRDQRNGDLLTSSVPTVTYSNDLNTDHPPDQPVAAGFAFFSGIDPGVATFTVKAANFATQKVLVKVIPKVTVDITVSLQRNPVVTGIVRDSQSFPIVVPGLAVKATPLNNDTGATEQQAAVSRTVTDATLSTTTPMITSLTAGFTAADVGRGVFGPNIPDKAKIKTVISPTEADIDPAPTAAASGQTVITLGNPGQYTFDGTLQPGTWNLQASAPGYVDSPPITVEVFLGQTVQKDISIQQFGGIKVDVLAPNTTDGSLVHVSGATVSLSGGPTTRPDQTTGDRDPVTFDALVSGLYTVTARMANFNEASTQALVGLDGTVSKSLLITPTTPAKASLSGRIVYDDNGTLKPVANARVSVSGVSYPPNRNPPPAFETIRSTTDEVPTFNDGTFTIDTKVFDFTLGDVHVVPDPNVSPATFVEQTFPNTPIWGASPSGAPRDFVVQPKSGTVTGSITYDPSTASDPKTAVIGTITSPAGTGISITVSDTGLIGLRDPRVTSGGVNPIKPGDYSVVFTRAGFEPAFPTAFSSGSFTVTPGGTVDLSAVLEKHGSASVSVTCTDSQNASNFVPPTARVTLTRGSFSASQVVNRVGTTVPSLTATFDDLVASGGSYSIDVHSAGCTDATGAVTVPPGEAEPTTITSDKLGSISGTVLSKINAASTITVAVQGATVSTTDPSGRTFTATTDANGNYFFGGVVIGTDPTADIDGLHPGTYTITASADGQQPPTVPPQATIDNTSTGEDDVTVGITMIAIPATVNGFVTENSSSGAGIVGATVTATSAAAGRTVTFVTTASTGAYSFTDLEPVLWTFTYTAPSHSSVFINFTLTAGATVRHDEALISRLNTISGVVKSQFGTDTPAPEGGVDVHVVATSDGNTTDTTVTSANSTGAYSVPALNDGSYAVTFSKAGFTDVTQNVSVGNGQNFVLNQTMVAIQAKTTVTIVSAVGSTPIGGTTVTIQPQSGKRGNRQQAVTGANGQAVFNQVPPSTYDVTITAVNGHRTVLDTATLAVPSGGTDVAKTFTIQEAHLSGTIKAQDTSSPATGLSPYNVQIYNGSSTTGTAAITAPTDANGKYSVFVPGRVDGYTFKFVLDANHNSDDVHVAATTGTDVTSPAGDYTFVKFASIAATVGSTAAAPTGSHYDYTTAIDGGAPFAGTTHTFSNLTAGNHTVNYTRTLVTGPSGSPPTTTTGTPSTKDNAVTLTAGQAGTDSFNFP